MTIRDHALTAQFWQQPALLRQALRFGRRKPVATLSAVFLMLIMVMALIAPRLTTHDPVATNSTAKLQAPGQTHILGTDELGRDVWSRLIYGARTSLVVGYGTTALALAIGTLIALISGYFGGTLDLTVQRVVDAFTAVPALLIILSVVAIVRPSVATLVLVLGLLFGVGSSRIVRSAVLATKTLLYVEAARAMGGGSARIILRHILPNITHVVIVAGSLMVGRVIIVEATIAFLGFGLPPPTPTWGGMLSGNSRAFMVQAPWMALAPGIAISLTVLAFNMLGDALRDVLDPRLRGST